MVEPVRTQTAVPSDDARSATEGSTWKPGDRFGRYQLLMPLAAGGMGMVFAARLSGAHGVERLVAIKTLRPITAANDRAALLREARVTARLHHRNVVATLDLGEVDDVPYVVMELVDGVALSRLVTLLATKREPLSPELAAWIVLQAANGLHAAHELKDASGRPLGLVHRDVSPQNILLSTSGEVKIADFGIAKFEGREESTATGMIKGKFAYMAPEQADAMPLDRRCDVFALGIVLWELLTLERLFHAETPAKTLLKVAEHRPRSPAELRPEVGEDLAAIVLRCLAKDPADRYATAADVADALRAVLRTRSAVDESDLARLIDRWYGAERREVMTQVTATADGTTQTLGEPSAFVAVAGSARKPPAARGLRYGVAAAAFVVVVAGGAASLRLLGGRPTLQKEAPLAETPAPLPAVVSSSPPSASSASPPAPPPAPPPEPSIAPRAPSKKAKPAPAPAKSASPPESKMFPSL